MIKKREVLLTIKGRILNEDMEDESVELKTQGIAFKENSQEGLTYEESSIYGMPGTTTTILVGKDFASIIRLGTINSELEFTPNKRNVTLFSTPYGEVQVGITTNNVNVEYTKDKWIKRVLIDYTIEIHYKEPLHNSIEIKVLY